MGKSLVMGFSNGEVTGNIIKTQSGVIRAKGSLEKILTALIFYKTFLKLY